jgi:hypothetical protein
VTNLDNELAVQDQIWSLYPLLIPKVSPEPDSQFRLWDTPIIDETKMMPKLVKVRLP